MKEEKKRFYSAVAILTGTCIGAGVLGIPYVAAQAGFFVALAYIILIGLMILTVNLYLGEISLRTKGNHQLGGYAEKYLGRKAYFLIEFATFFGIYAAIVAYILGVAKSFSFLAFGDASYYLFVGVGFGLMMSFLLWKGLTALKQFERWGVTLVLFLLLLMFIIFFKDINVTNLYSYNLANVFLPFGVVLFALMSFHAVPEVEIVLHKNEKFMKRVIVTSMIICILFYSLFAFIVVGFKGLETPQIATLTLGTIFVLLGILTMFTSYLSLGNALAQNLFFDGRMGKKKAWFISAIVPIVIFVLTQFFDYFSFSKILSIGGTVSGGMIGVLVLLMVRNAKKKGNRKPEYEMPVNWFVIGLFSLIFIAGVIWELAQVF